MTAVRGMLEK